ncbi:MULTISPECIES: alpha/beta hydrolase [Sphingobacterium]|uniref:alpha/beta hydrolase n=1 Tax=Sphingobacterium TaxID=28453 RepID=UPI00257CFF13|nr:MULTISPECIES: alpha/beta fold hydrolase [Sphingobacterium]
MSSNNTVTLIKFYSHLWLRPILVLLLFIFLSPVVHAQSNNKSKVKTNWNEILEEQLFPGKKLQDSTFSFQGKFEEQFITTADHVKLHGILFKADKSKGLIFYLHGSNGAVDTWGKIANIYTDNGYDLFMLDYRGYGKSEGKVTNEELLYRDLQTVYDKLTQQYPEDHIIIIGQSMGTALASTIASHNSPKMLILQAPYYSFQDWTQHVAPELDTSGIPFYFDNAAALQKVKCRTIIFHGDQDNAVYFDSSIKLSNFFKKQDKLIRLAKEGHNDFSKNKDYLHAIGGLLR